MAETGTALAVIQSQQNIVGRSVVGGSSAVLGSSTDSSTGILEQIREISLNQLRVLRQLVDRFSEMIYNQEESERRLRDQAAEQQKETVQTSVDSGQTYVSDNNAENEGKEKASVLSRLSGFLMGLPGAAVLATLLTPITKFFGIFKMFGRFGPIGGIILGFTLLFKYSKEIGEALTPVVEKIKNLMTMLQPVTDILKKIGDFFMITIVEGLGNVLGGLIDDITQFFGGFGKLISGDIIGGVQDIFGGILKLIFAIPMAILRAGETLVKNLVEAFEPTWDNLVVNVNNFVGQAFDNVIGWFSNIGTFISDLFSTAWTNITTFFSDMPNKILGYVSHMFSPIIDFFKSIGLKIKTAVNGIIESLPLPDFIKNKMKFDTAETEEDIEGVKKQYKESINPMEREIITGDSEGITQDEALAELTGEKYIKTNIKKSGTSGYDSAAGVLTPNQYEELNKFETVDQQIAYLDSLNQKEQERREKILSLARQKIDFQKQQAELKKELELQQQQKQEMMIENMNTLQSPDDMMFIPPAKKVLVTEQQTGSVGQTNVSNNPITVQNVTSTKKADMTINKLNPSAGDPYFDRLFYNGA